MKKFLVLLCVVMLTGCASYVPHGVLYTSGKMGIQHSDVKIERTGRACMNSFLGMFAFGDASIAAAKLGGGIDKIATIDYEVENILGIYGEYCTVVRGA